ncbi:MAG: hypothetical protein WAV73_04975 [Candidatus Moraniibacteriota bacterium]
MKNFWKKHRIVLVISAFLLIILPLFCWATLFMVARVKAKADLIQEKMVDDNLEKTKIEKIPKMEEVNAEFEKNKDATGIILNANNKVDFIEYIESLAAETKNDVEIKVLNDDQNNAVVKEAAKTKTAKKNDAGEAKKSIEEQLLYKQYISMQVDLRGDYAGFLNFVHKLENNKYYVNIVSFNLQKELIKADSSKKQDSPPTGIFLSPPGQSNPEIESDGDLILKSSLNIIVYIE